MSGGCRLRIAHVLAPASFGGLEEVVHALAAGHAAREHHISAVVVIDPGTDPHPCVERLRAAEVNTIALEVRPRAYVYERRAVRRHLAAIGPQIVHTHGERADVLNGPVARQLGLPVVTTVHGFTGGDWKKLVYEYLQRRAYRKRDAVVAVSRAQAADLMRYGVPSARLHVVPNAWRPIPQLDRHAARRALGIGDRDIRIGWVGRLSSEKGPDVAIRSLAHTRHPSVSLSVVGDGRLRNQVRALSERLGVAQRVWFHGLVPDAGRLTRAFDVFLLSSRTEGIPIALFEAMAAGVPVVATAVGGVPEVVSEREAWLVPPEDPVALARALDAAVADVDARAAKSAAAGARLIEDFGFEQWLDRYENVYRSLRWCDR